jgi:hypothetical protein
MWQRGWIASYKKIKTPGRGMKIYNKKVPLKDGAAKKKHKILNRVHLGWTKTSLLKANLHGKNIKNKIFSYLRF